MSLNETVSKLDLEPTFEELECAVYAPRFQHLLDDDDFDWRDFMCMVENQLRRERGLIPA
jgi:hypothetical protein